MKKQVKAHEERKVKSKRQSVFLSLLELVSRVVRFVTGASTPRFSLGLLHLLNLGKLLSRSIFSIEQILSMRKP
jgi:hypothetical protein